MQIDLLVGGNTYSLTDNNPIYIEEYDGWGEAPVHRLMERGPQQHGASDVGFRLDPRTGMFRLRIRAADASAMWTARAQVLSWFRPTTAVKKIRFTLDNGAVRVFEGHSAGAMTLPHAALDGYHQRIGCSFLCPDPTCYDPVAQVATFRLGGGGTGMPVPLLVPVTVGASAISESRTILYTGSWRALPVIRITGPITDCVVTNVSTGDKLDLTGVTIAEGDWYEIDLRYGHKTVVDRGGANRIADLTEDSDLATWHLAADDEVPDGVNSITVTGSGLDAGTRIDITYHARYTGI